MPTNVKLIINLRLIGLDLKEIDFCYKSYLQSKIDKETYSYISAEEYFQKNKASILKILNLQVTDYNVLIPPQDIEMGPKGIYIEKENRRIAALFKTLKLKDKTIEIRSILYQKLLCGGLLWLYKKDKEKQSDIEYESIFDDCPSWIIEQLENRWIDEQLIIAVMEYLETKDRFLFIVRMLLSGSSELQIPNKEIHAKNSVTSKDAKKERKIYRAPYVDD